MPEAGSYPVKSAPVGTDTVLVWDGALKQATITALLALVIDAAPGSLDTLNELAAALGDDANFAATVTAALADKADTSAVAELARDALGTALTAGDGIVLTVDDGADTITIAAGQSLDSPLDYGALVGMSARLYRNSSLAWPWSGGTITEVTGTQLGELSDGDSADAITSVPGSGNYYALVLLFPSPVTIGAAKLTNGFGGNETVWYSTDSTDGTDGTWLSTGATGLLSGQTEVGPLEGVVALGFQFYAEYYWNTIRLRAVDLWGIATELTAPSLLQPGDDGDVLATAGGSTTWLPGIVVVDAGADLSAARPITGGTVYWKFDNGTDPGTDGANVTNAEPGDLYYVASA